MAFILSLFTSTGERLTGNQKAKNNFNVTKTFPKENYNPHTVKIAHQNQTTQKKQYQKD